MVSFRSGRTWLFTADFAAAEIFFDVNKLQSESDETKATDVFCWGLK